MSGGERLGGEDADEQVLADEAADGRRVVEVPAAGRADEREEHAGDEVGRGGLVEAGTEPALALLALEVRDAGRR